MSTSRKKQEQEQIAAYISGCAIWDHEAQCWQMPDKLSEEEQRIYDELTNNHRDNRDCNLAACSARRNHEPGIVGSFYCDEDRSYIFGTHNLDEDVTARRLVVGCTNLFPKLGVPVLGFQSISVAWAMMLGTWSFELCETVVRFCDEWARGVPGPENPYADDLETWQAEHVGDFDVLEYVMPDRDA